MDRFIVARDVTKILPKMQVVIVVAYNLDNKGENQAVNHYCQVRGTLIRQPKQKEKGEGETTTASTILADLSAYPNAQSHPRIALYRDTLKKSHNLSAKKFPQSNESLYKRLLKEKKALRQINPLVDFYNSVSIKHGVTAGAFDLGDLQTRSQAPLELRHSTSADTFKALDAGSDESAAPVAEGELVYVQDSTVLTRHLAWRQAAEGLVTEATRNVIFMSEVFNGDEDMTGPTKLTKSVADEFVNGLKEFFGVEARATILGERLSRWTVEVENAFF
ncbi:MAG: hypothetical protein Q9216_002475 [Gyalolechia sp. 2 TL-2023]